MFSISAVLLSGLAVVVLCKWAGLKAWHALVCVLFGFFLATSPLAPAVRAFVEAIAILTTGSRP